VDGQGGEDCPILQFWPEESQSFFGQKRVEASPGAGMLYGVEAPAFTKTTSGPVGILSCWTQMS
jgi:hypothetical protein